MSTAYERDEPVYTEPRQELGKSSVREALQVQETFDRAQVAWLMQQAMRWGYDLGYEDGQRDELALATVAAEYANTHPFSAQVTADSLKKRAYRAECDAAARLPRSGDFKGINQPRDRDLQAAA